MKVFIIGYGSIASKHHKALLEIDPLIEVYALRSQPNACQIDNIHSIYSYSEVKINAPYDFVIISNPTYKHIETIEHIIDLKCPLFIEKPLSHTLECNGLLNKISKSGLKTYVACNLRFLDSLVYLKEKLLPGLTVNEINVYCGSYLPDWRPGSDYKASYSAYANRGGGAHLDLIHELDYIYWLFGKPAHVNSFRSSKSTLGIDAVDYANYLLEYESFAVSVVLNYFRIDKKRTLELVCEDDTYTVDLFNNKVTNSTDVLFQSEQVFSDTYVKQMKYFIEKAVAGKDNMTMMNDIYEAYEVLKICLQ